MCCSSCPVLRHVYHGFPSIQLPLSIARRSGVRLSTMSLLVHTDIGSTMHTQNRSVGYSQCSFTATEGGGGIETTPGFLAIEWVLSNPGPALSRFCLVEDDSVEAFQASPPTPPPTCNALLFSMPHPPSIPPYVYP